MMPTQEEREALELADGEEVTDEVYAGLAIFTVATEEGTVKRAVCKGGTLEAPTVGELVEIFGQRMQERDA